MALDRLHAPLQAELRAAFDRVLEASDFVLGEELNAFEGEFAGFCGVDHCVGTASGTSALTLALQAAGIGPGDEVIVPAHTFIASALAVVHAGATPVLCEVDRWTALLDPAAVARCVTERTSAIIAVHLYGQCCDMEALAGLARDRGLLLVEDAAQAHGATWRGRPAGSLGDVACFSFYPSKNLGALGDGGAVCTSDASLAANVRARRNLGQARKGQHNVLGANERLDGMQAALLRVKLPRLAAQNEARRAHARDYRTLLESLPIDLLVEREDAFCVYHLFPVRLAGRDEVAEALADVGIGTGIHYAPTVQHHAALADFVRVPEPVPQAEAWARHELSLPMFAELRTDELQRVATELGTALDERRG